MKKSILLFFLLAGCSLSRGIEVTDLKGKTAEEIEKKQGKPVTIRRENDEQMWAYKKDECYLLIFLDATKTVQFAESRGNCPE